MFSSSTGGSRTHRRSRRFELRRFTGLLDDDILVNDTWMRVLYDGAPIGYVHRNVDTDDTDPQRHIHINNQLHLRVRLLGRPQDIRVESSAFLDLVRKLQSFEADIRSPLMNLSLQAIRRPDGRFGGAMNVGGDSRAINLEIPDDAVIFSPLTDAAATSLRPGRRARVPVFNPITMERDHLMLHAVRRETVRIDDTPYDCLLLESTLQGVTVRTWVDRQRTVIRQETPFGWTLEHCSSDAALEALQASTGGPDLLQFLTRRLLHPGE